MGVYECVYEHIHTQREGHAFNLVGCVCVCVCIYIYTRTSATRVASERSAPGTVCRSVCAKGHISAVLGQPKRGLLRMRPVCVCERERESIGG